MDPYISAESLDRDNPNYEVKIENLIRSDKNYRRGNYFLNSLPVKAIFQTTYRCNLNCPHCQLSGHERGFDMDFSLFEKISDELFPSLVEMHPSNVGEPLISPWFTRMCDKMHSYGVLLDLTTNGALLDDKMIKCIKPIARDVKVSFDGATKETFERFRKGAKYESVIRNVKRMVLAMKDAEIPLSTISLQMTLMSSNYLELPSLVRMAAEMEVDKVKAYHMFSFNEHMEKESLMPHLTEYHAILEESLEIARSLGVKMECAEPSGGTEDDLREQVCHLPWYESFIDYDGTVYVCHSHGGKAAGQCSLIPFNEIWNSSLYVDVRAGMSRNQPVWNCGNCGMRYSKSTEHQMVPLDPESFLYSNGNTEYRTGPIRWSGRMKQFDLRRSDH